MALCQALYFCKFFFHGLVNYAGDKVAEVYAENAWDKLEDLAWVHIFW